MQKSYFKDCSLCAFLFVCASAFVLFIDVTINFFMKTAQNRHMRKNSATLWSMDEILC